MHMNTVGAQSASCSYSRTNEALRHTRATHCEHIVYRSIPISAESIQLFAVVHALLAINFGIEGLVCCTDLRMMVDEVLDRCFWVKGDCNTQLPPPVPTVTSVWLRRRAVLLYAVALGQIGSGSVIRMKGQALATVAA